MEQKHTLICEQDNAFLFNIMSRGHFYIVGTSTTLQNMFKTHNIIISDDGQASFDKSINRVTPVALK